MDTTTIELQDAREHWQEILSLAMAGQTVTITQANKPVLRLIPADKHTPHRIAGLQKGMGWISEDFDAYLGDEFWAGTK
ncbi:MAG: hypothetical protein OHK0052_08190 [Anaerolineales bacterium]